MLTFFEEALGFRVANYGMTKWSDLFTPRQLVALDDLQRPRAEAREQVNAKTPSLLGLDDDRWAWTLAAAAATAYAEAVSVYLGVRYI